MVAPAEKVSIALDGLYFGVVFFFERVQFIQSRGPSEYQLAKLSPTLVVLAELMKYVSAG